MSSGKHKLMILDCNGLAHAVKHSTKGLSYKGNRTGILYGFIKMLLKLQESLQADNWLFAWDSRNGYLRQKEDPTYKANRQEKTEEDKQMDAWAYPQFNLLRSKLLTEIGFSNVVCVDGFESDDLMAEAALSEYGRNYDCTIVTRDKDLYQCLAPNVRMYDPIGEKIYTVERLREEWGCSPEEWVQAMAIAGCDGDNVKGVPGVGMKTAIKFLHGQLKETTKTWLAISTDQLANHRFNMVYLPHWRTPKVPIKLTNELAGSKLMTVASRYGMRSLMTPAFKERWEEAFK